MLNIGGQVSGLPKPCNVFLLNRGGYPSALRDGSGHIGGFGVLRLGFRVLELEVREGARKVEKRHRARPLYKGGEYQESSACPLETYPKIHGVIPTVVVGLHTPILMENPVIRGTRSVPRRDVPIKLPRNASRCGVGNVSSHWIEPGYKGTTHEDCQQIRSIPCKDHLADPDTVYVFDNHFGVF